MFSYCVYLKDQPVAEAALRIQAETHDFQSDEEHLIFLRTNSIREKVVDGHSHLVVARVPREDVEEGYQISGDAGPGRLVPFVLRDLVAA